ncbi:MAG: hypothetical protein U0354_19530 [Candidatus Sericytochromatia bacterium]
MVKVKKQTQDVKKELLKIDIKEKNNLSPKQKEFNRLVESIEVLEKEIINEEKKTQ